MEPPQKQRSCKEFCKTHHDFNHCYNECQIEKEQPIIQIISISCIVIGLIFLLFIIWKRKQVMRLFRCFLNKRQLMFESFLNNAVLIKNSNLLLKQLRRINSLLNNSSNEFFFTQNGKLHKEENVQIFSHINEREQYIKIQLKGSDKYGDWIGNGATIIDFSNQLKIWFIKDYDEQKEARNSGIWEHLIYQGEFDEDVKAFSGRWYYDGLQDDLTYSGTWILKIN